MAMLTSPQKSLLSEVVFVYKMIFLAPATNAASERSCSALRRTKIWLRTTMNQSLTDALDLDTVTSDFLEGNERRLHLFGRITH